MPTNFKGFKQGGNTIPVKDMAAMTWEANAVLGARNIFNFNNRTGSGTTTGTTDNFNLSGTGTYRSAEFTMPVEPNTSYKIKFNVEVTSGLCFANAYDVTNSVTLATGIQVTQNTNGYTLEFSTNSTTEIVRVGVFCTGGTSATGDITVKKLEIVLASDTYNDYTPPAMTNKELTDMVTPIEDECTEILTGATASVNKLIKVGKIVTLDLQLSSVTASSYNEILAKIPNGFKPKVNTYVLAWINTGINGNAMVLIGVTGNIQLALTDLSSKSCYIHAVWVTV